VLLISLLALACALPSAAAFASSIRSVSSPVARGVRSCEMSAAASDSGDKKRKRADTPSPTQVLEFLKICGKLKKTARTGWVRCGVAKHESVADHSWRMGVLPMLLSDVKGIDATRCMKIGLVHDLAEALVGDITPHCGVTKEEKSKLEADAMARIRSSVPNTQNFPATSRNACPRSRNSSPEVLEIPANTFSPICKLSHAPSSHRDCVTWAKFGWKTAEKDVALFLLEACSQQRECEQVGESAVGEEIVSLWEEYEAGETAEARLMKDMDKFEMIVQAEDYETEQGLDLSQFFESTVGKIKHPEVAAWEKALRASREERRAAKS